MTDAVPEILSSRIFSMADQLAFARLSGDANPVHVDPVAARRSVVGGIVVHGVHTLLWALDVAAQNAVLKGVSAIDAIFPKPLYPGEEVSVGITARTEKECRLTAQVGDKRVATILLTLAERRQTHPTAVSLPLVPAGEAKENDLPEIAGQQGTVDIAATANDFEKCFPHAARLLGADVLRALAGCSRLVGMECPGLRSVFSRLTLSVAPEHTHAPLSYAVVSVDERFSLIRMEVRGLGIAGRVEAFSPPPPAAMGDVSEMKTHMKADEFKGQVALVLGGSRGLGELAAKAIAAGGGHVIVSYAAGRADANRVVDEISSTGGQAQAVSYDVTKPAAGQLQHLGTALPTHLYYFASGRIARAKAHDFEPALLAQFMQFYVYGLQEICVALVARGARTLKVFYPSTVFVESRPHGMTEYAMAKAAGEILCADMPLMMPGVDVFVERLPRLPTDQNMAMTAQDLPDAFETMLPLIRKLA